MLDEWKDAREEGTMARNQCAGCMDVTSANLSAFEFFSVRYRRPAEEVTWTKEMCSSMDLVCGR